MTIFSLIFSLHNCFPFLSPPQLMLIFFLNPGAGIYTYLWAHCFLQIFFDPVPLISIPSVCFPNKLYSWTGLSIEQCGCTTITFLSTGTFWMLCWFSSLTYLAPFFLLMTWHSDNKARHLIHIELVRVLLWLVFTGIRREGSFFWAMNCKTLELYVALVSFT